MFVFQSNIGAYCGEHRKKDQAVDFICGWLNSIALIDYQTMVTLRSCAEVEDRKKCVFKGTKPVTLSV